MPSSAAVHAACWLACQHRHGDSSIHSFAKKKQIKLKMKSRKRSLSKSAPQTRTKKSKHPPKPPKPPSKASPRQDSVPPSANYYPAPRCFSPQSPNIRICISGYSQAHWHRPGSYYENIPKTKEFKFYSQEFNTVELNSTFYGFFSEKTFVSWAENAQNAKIDFKYVVKASQLYTHKKKLNVDDFFRTSWDAFWKRVTLLGSSLGPVLFQLPHQMKRYTAKGADNLDKLKNLATVLPRNHKFVYEFRDLSWYCQDVYSILKENDWCLAMIDVHDDKASSHPWYGTLHHGANPKAEEYMDLGCCSSWGAYIRFHGSTGQYEGSYGKKVMSSWAKRIARWVTDDNQREVYVAFNNTDEATLPSAIQDARWLAEGLRSLGVF